jgi:hypothetical protein
MNLDTKVIDILKENLEDGLVELTEFLAAELNKKRKIKFELQKIMKFDKDKTSVKFIVKYFTKSKNIDISGRYSPETDRIPEIFKINIKSYTAKKSKENSVFNLDKDSDASEHLTVRGMLEFMK